MAPQVAAPALPYVPNVQERLSSGAKQWCSAECPRWCCHPGLAAVLIRSISQEQQEEQDTGEGELLLHLLECMGDSQLCLSDFLWDLSVFSQVPVRFWEIAAFPVGSSISCWGFS